jgi:nicotinamidase/pyrazinamidase
MSCGPNISVCLDDGVIIEGVKTVFFDVDTQLDFLFPAGALYVPGAEHTLKALRELISFASGNGVQIISTADAHLEDDPEFKTWRPHCVAGTTGQQKAVGTLLANAVVIGSEVEGFKEGRDRLNAAPQIVVEKQQVDCFTNPNLPALLDLLAADRYVVYGVVTELCVRCAAFGLLKTFARVELVADAIKSLDTTEGNHILSEFQAAGGVITTVVQVVG